MRDTLIRELGELLDRLGVKQKRIAAALGIHESTYSSWLYDRSDLPSTVRPEGLVAFIEEIKVALLDQKTVIAESQLSYHSQTRSPETTTAAEQYPLGATANATAGVVASPRSLDPNQLAGIAGKALLDILEIATTATFELGLTHPNRREIPSPRPGEPGASPGDGTLG